MPPAPVVKVPPAPVVEVPPAPVVDAEPVAPAVPVPLAPVEPFDVPAELLPADPVMPEELVEVNPPLPLDDPGMEAEPAAPPAPDGRPVSFVPVPSLLAQEANIPTSRQARPQRKLECERLMVLSVFRRPCNSLFSTEIAG